MKWLLVGLCPWIVFRGLDQRVLSQEPASEEPRLFDAETPDIGELEPSSTDREPFDSATLDAAEFVAPPARSASEGPPARWQIHPHLDAKTTYDDNIFIQPRDKKPDVSFTLSPGLTAGYFDSPEASESYLTRGNRSSRIYSPAGSFLIADYTLSILEFVHHSAENSVDHDLSLDAQWSREKLRLGIHYHFLTGAGADIDIGGRVNRQVQTIIADARYDLSEKFFLESTFARIASDPKGFVSARENRLTATINYSLTPLFSAGFGGAIGELKVDNSASEHFEQILLRTRYSVTDKLVFDATGGVELRQDHNSNTTGATPAFDLGVSYTPIEGTQLTGDAFRRTENSALQGGNDYVLLGANGRLGHFLSHGIYITLGAGYRQADYTDAMAAARRKDRYYYVQPGVLWNVNRALNIQLLYMHGSNHSNYSQFGFSNNQIELRASVIF